MSFQEGTLVPQRCSEVSILSVAVAMYNANYWKFFLWNELGPCWPVAGSGVSGVNLEQVEQHKPKVLRPNFIRPFASCIDLFCLFFWN